MKFVEDDSLYERPKQARGEAFVDAVFNDLPSEVTGDEAAPDKASEAMLKSDGNVTSNSIGLTEASESVVGENHVEVSTDETAKKKAVKLSARRVGLMVAMVVGLIGAFVAAQVWLDKATLKTFIITGNRIVAAEEITAKLSGLLNQRLDDVSLAEIEKTIEGHSFIRKAVATRELPSSIRLRITEREPVAIASVGGNLKLIDDGGNVLDFESKVFETRRLPLLKGFGSPKRSANGLLKLDSAESAAATEFLLSLRKAELARLVISEVDISHPKKLFALTGEGNTKFYFGDRGEYDEKLIAFETFWKEVIVKKGARTLEYVDLRFDQKIFAKNSDAAVNPRLQRR